MPSRRTYLAGVGALLAATAGCTSKSSESTPTDTPSDTPDDPPSGSVSVSDVGVRKAVTYESTMGSGGVLAAEGRQYVVASVTADAELSASEFAFAAGDDVWAPGLPDTVGGVNRSVAGREGFPLGDGGYDSETKAHLAFVVPSPLSASAPEIRYAGEESGRWPLDETARETLTAPEPNYEVESIDVPGEIRQGKDFEVSLTVRNVSETDGRFLAALYWPTELIADDDESHVIERTVDAGETATVRRSIDTRSTTNEEKPVSLRVRGHVAAEREVYVTDASTP